MDREMLQEISKILDKDIDSITKEDALKIGMLLTDMHFHQFVKRTPEDMAIVMKKVLDLMRKIQCMKSIPERLLYMIPLPIFLFFIPDRDKSENGHYTNMRMLKRVCEDVFQKAGYGASTYRFLFKDGDVVRIPNLTVGIAKDISTVKEPFVKSRAIPPRPELTDYFADRNFVYAGKLDITYPVYVRAFKVVPAQGSPISSIAVDDMIFTYMQKKMNLPMVAYSNRGDNTEIYVDTDDIERAMSIMLLKKNDVWRHSIEAAESRWNRIDDPEYFGKKEVKDWGNVIYADGDRALLYFTPRLEKSYYGNIKSPKKHVVLMDGDAMFVNKGGDMLDLAEKFFFPGIDRCLELEKEKEQLVKELPDMDR